MKELLKIYAIWTKRGFYITDNPSNNSYGSHGERALLHYLFDGVHPDETFHECWGHITKAPTIVSHIQKQPNINHRFVLADDSLASERIPLEIKREDAGEQVDCQTFRWKDELAMYSSLYVPVSDEQPDIETNDEFEFNVLFKVDALTDPPEFKYHIGDTYDRWSSKMLERHIVRSEIQHQDLDKIIFPSAVIHLTPCRLTSKQTYDIVRQHIKDNINPKVAEVTSDYDFCFRVRKRVPITKPYVSEYQHTPRGRRKAETRTRLISERPAPCFEMTYSPENYKGHTPIKEFEGKDESDLKLQIDSYLKDLMDIINEPLKECPACLGTGMVKELSK